MAHHDAVRKAPDRSMPSGRTAWSAVEIGGWGPPGVGRGGHRAGRRDRSGQSRESRNPMAEEGRGPHVKSMGHTTSERWTGRLWGTRGRNPTHHPGPNAPPQRQRTTPPAMLPVGSSHDGGPDPTTPRGPRPAAGFLSRRDKRGIQSTGGCAGEEPVWRLTWRIGPSTSIPSGHRNNGLFFIEFSSGRTHLRAQLTRASNVTLRSEIAYCYNVATANQIKPYETSVGPFLFGVTKTKGFAHTDNQLTIGRVVYRASNWLK